MKFQSFCVAFNFCDTSNEISMLFKGPTRALFNNNIKLRHSTHTLSYVVRRRNVRLRFTTWITIRVYQRRNHIWHWFKQNLICATNSLSLCHGALVFRHNARLLLKQAAVVLSQQLRPLKMSMDVVQLSHYVGEGENAYFTWNSSVLNQARCGNLIFASSG